MVQGKLPDTKVAASKTKKRVSELVHFEIYYIIRQHICINDTNLYDYLMNRDLELLL